MIFYVIFFQFFFYLILFCVCNSPFQYVFFLSYQHRTVAVVALLLFPMFCCRHFYVSKNRGLSVRVVRVYECVYVCEKPGVLSSAHITTSLIYSIDTQTHVVTYMYAIPYTICVDGIHAIFAQLYGSMRW